MSGGVNNILYVGNNVPLAKAMFNVSTASNDNLDHLHCIDNIQAVLTAKNYTHFICELPLSAHLAEQIAFSFPLLKTTYLLPLSPKAIELSAVTDGLLSDEVKTTLDLLTIPIYFKNGKGQLLAFNSYFSQLVELPAKQLLGKTLAELLPDYQGKEMEKLENDRFSERLVEFYECRVVDAKGDGHDLIFRQERVADGKMIVGMLFDVTDINKAKFRLENERIMLRAMTDISTDLIFFKDLQSRFLGCNKQFERFVGCSEPEIIGKKDEQLFELEQALMCQTQDKKVLLSKQAYIGEEYLTYKTGERHFIEMKKVPLQDKQGRVQGLIGIGRDITSHYKVQRRLKIADSVFENSKENIIVTDEMGNIISVNKACCAISGFSKSELLRANIAIFQSNQHETIREALQRNNSWQGDASYRFKNGDISYAWVEAYLIEHADSGGHNRIYSFTDLNHSRSCEEKIQFLSKHDPLTGLFNRIALFSRLEDAITRALYKEVTMAVILVDINGFKAINDQYDHNAGDTVLKEIAARLKSCVFGKDTVARFGDDEFVIIVDELSSEQDGAVVAQKIAAQFRRKFMIENIAANLSATIGISICPDDGTNIDTLLGNAEKAMQRGKKDKSAPYHFYTMALTHHSNQQLKLEEELKQALLLEQFELYYQPQYDLNKRQIVAVEALLRWNHPCHGVQHPDSFLILAENCGLLVPLSLLMLRKAAIQAVIWDKQGINFGRIALDLSEAQLSQISFISDLQTILLESKCASHWLEFEIDEVVFASSDSIVHDNLLNIRKLGIALSITNYAAVRPALQHIELLQIKKFKISKKWVQALPDDHLGQAMIDMLIILAHSLGMDVVGDGIDNAQQQILLSQKNFDSGQGKFLAKAMKASEATFYLRCNKRK